MILPSKRLPTSKALLTVGGYVLSKLNSPRTVSALWHEIRANDVKMPAARRITFEWFILSLDLLFTIQAIDLRDGLLARRGHD